MRSFLLNKLVRDNIVSNMQKLGQQVTFKKLNDAEYLKALIAKVQEEAHELSLASKEDAPKELTDLLEAIEALAVTLGTDFDQLRTLQAKRKASRGGFEKRLFVERLDLADDDSWAEYYANEPERFKELKG